MANKFAKLSTPALEKKIFEASAEDKVLIQEVLDKRTAAVADFSDKKPAKAAKAEPKKPEPKAKKADAEPKKAAKAEPKKADKKTVTAKAPRQRHELIGKTAKFTIHGTALELKGPIARVITGTDDKPYIGIADADGKIKFKQLEQSTVYGMPKAAK